MGQWLNELRLKYEPECMNILQSKSIATSEDDCRISTIVCTDSKVIQDLYHRTKAVSDEFKRVYEYGAFKHVLYNNAQLRSSINQSPLLFVVLLAI